MSDIVEADAVEEAPSTAVVHADHATTLFRTDDPVQVLSRAQATAEALMPVVRDKGLIVRIQTKDHLTVEAWQTLGAMLGVTPVCVWTRKLEDGWEARVEARTLDGRVIGAAEAQCDRSEGMWKKRDEYALRSMAQTRATSKALASVLRFVATLAGASGTPAEEMPRDSAGRSPSDAQLGLMERLLKGAELSPTAIAEIRAWAKDNLTGGRDGTASAAIEMLKKDARATAANLAAKAKVKPDDVPADTEGLG